MSIGAMEWLGAGLRGVLNPFVFEFSGYNPSQVDRQRRDNLAVLQDLTGTNHLARYVEHITQVFAKAYSEGLGQGRWFRWVIDWEEDLVVAVAANTFIFAFRNCVEESIQNGGSHSFPLAAVVKRVMSIFQQHLQLGLPEAIQGLLFRNNASQIPAPYPVNRVIMNTIGSFAASPCWERLANFCKTEDLERELKRSEEGRVALEFAGILSARLEEILLTQLKQPVVDALVGVIEKEEVRPFFRSWLEKQVDKVVEEGALEPARRFVIRWVRAAFLRNYQKVNLERIADYLEGKLDAKAFVEQIFLDLDWEKGEGLGLTEEMAPLTVPLMKDGLVRLLQNDEWEDVQIWIKESGEWQEKLTEEEKKLSALAGERAYEHLKMSIHPMGSPIVDPLKLSGSAIRFLRRSFLSETRLSELLKKQLQQYTACAVQKALVGAGRAIAKQEEEDPEFLTLNLLGRILDYLRSNLIAMHRSNSTEIPRCDALSVDILHFIGIHESNLPLPKSQRKAIWKYLTETLVPTQLKALFNQHCTSHQIEEKLYTVLTMIDLNAEAPNLEPAPEELRRKCVLCVQEFMKSTNSRLIHWLSTEAMKEKFGKELADLAYFYVKEWPMSSIHKEGVSQILSFLESPHTPAAGQQKGDMREIVGHILEQQVARAASSAARKITRGIGGPIHYIFQGISRFICDGALSYVDLFGFALSNHLFTHEEPNYQRVRVLDQSFVMLESYHPARAARSSDDLLREFEQE